ncbi:hypothetical protein [Bradyrhizobium sp. BTAi1]|uniref:hypothetical protein n=1 Tax=Bradyrhizobium sp. (strain BTAi1 / ATCC BAA-1182) TaxID=288000 RepID=UPI00005DE87D|nr:hypothetical protein [Bradyrhizobium sp. BTAi1]ABQ39865.1 putative exported protein of unknown function [Bradyrhizobium sp. BTAi1]
MNLTKMLAIAAVAALATGSALAQSTQTTPDTENNGHHYSGGPKTEVPHHMGKKDMGMASDKKKGAGGSHHYSGGPNSDVPHHTGAK